MALKIRKTFRSIDPTEDNLERKVRLANLYWLPTEVTNGLYEALGKLEYDKSQPASDFLKKAEGVALEAVSKKPFWRRIDWKGLVIAAILFAFAWTLSLVMAGSWSNALH